MPIYMQFDGIAGDSTSSLHPHTFEINSFSWGVTNPVNISGNATGHTIFQPVTINMPLQSHTVELMLATVNGKRFLESYLFDTLTQGSKQFDVQIMRFTNLELTSWVESSSGELPAVQFTCEYSKVILVSQFPNADGVLQSDEVSWTTQFSG